MGCSSSSAGGSCQPRKVLTKIPDWPQENKSLLRKHLTQDVFDKLKDSKDQAGASLADISNSGICNPKSSIGVYATCPDSYTTFAPLLDRIIEEYHGHGPEAKHVSRWDSDQCHFENFDPENKYCKSTRIRVARNLDGVPLGTFISKEQRKQVESDAKTAFASFEGDLKGTYYSLETMKKSEQQQLIADHFLFKEGDKYLEAAGLNRDWPSGRGIFHNNDKTFLVWVNEEDQFRIISMQNGGDIKAVFNRLERASNAIEKVKKFARNDHLGYITTCPTNCGTGLRASIHIKVPLLSAQQERFQKIADQFNVQIRGVDGEHSESKDGTYDVSNKRRLGFSEFDLVQDMYNGVKAMIEAEKELEGKK